MLKIHLKYWTLVLGVLCFVTVPLHAQSSGSKCTIKSMVGDVKIQRKKSPKWIKARPNMPLRESDAIRTFVESEAVIQTADGSRISLKENTTLELSALSKSSDGASKTGVKILSGDLMANVKKLVNKKSKFEFETPTAVAAIRGTRVGFDVDKDKTNIKVYEGKVYVVPKGARKGAELKSNQMTTVVKGQKKVKVQKMAEPEEEKKSAVADDTTEVVTDTTAKDTTAAEEEDTTATADTTSDVKLVLKVFSPDNGQIVIPESQISVAGKVFPPKATVRVRGSEVPVKPNGEFRRVIKAPKEEAQYTIEIEAVYLEQTKTVTRYVMIKMVPVDLKLTVNEPRNGQIVNKPLIRVSGLVTPGADVTVSGMNISVAPNGGFSKDVPIPDEEGEIVLEIEASLGQDTKTETRTVVYKMLEEDVFLSVQMPADKQVVCDRKVQVKGMVKPVTIKEVSVNGTDVPVRNGLFSDYITIPDEPGEHDVEFEVSRENDSKTARRIVRFDPSGDKCNADIPTIQPASFPLNAKISRIAFTVYDKTPSDEITFFSSVDGSKDSETGAPGSRFYVDLEEGIHTYEVYAEDLAGNKSQKITGTVTYLMKDPLIRLANPSGPYKLLHIPPSTPLGSFRPEFTVEFSVENLPDDNPKLLKEVKVINKLSGDIKSLKKFTTDIDFDFDINLKRGRNPIIIEVRDVNDRIITRDLVIEIK